MLTTAGLDFTPLPATILTFSSSKLSQTISVDIKVDNQNEVGEYFEIVIVNATIRDASGTEVNLSEEELTRLRVVSARILDRKL